MKRKALLKSALAWILALSMAVPNTALTAYAAETGMAAYAEQNGQEQEEKAGNGEENPGGGEAGEENPNGEEAGEENPDGGEAGEENPGGGEAGEENPGGGEAGEENPGGEEAGEENPGGGEAGEENPDGGEAGEENPDGEEAGEDTPDDEETGEGTQDKEELTVQETDATGEERFSGIEAKWSAYSLVSISNGSSVKFAFSEEDKANLSKCSAAYVELDADGQKLGTKSIQMYTTGYIYGSRLHLRANTRSVKLRVTLTLKSGENRVYESAPLARPECVCAPVFSLEPEGEAGAGTAVFRWSVSGYAAPEGQADKEVEDDFTLKLSCQPEAGETFSIDVSKSRTSGDVTLEGLAADTTYQMQAEFYIADAAGEKVFTQTTAPVTIQTKENTEYDFKTIIPDERLRELIAKQITGKTKDSETITQSELEKVTYLSMNRSKYADAAVKSLKGIEYLTELKTIYLENHEVSDISDVEWGSLKKLTTLNLEGNNLEAVPAIEAAPSLKNAVFSENLLTTAAIDAAGETVRQLKARGGSVSFDRQRAGGVRLLTEPVYYQVDGKTALAVRIRGIRSYMDNTVSFQVDGAEKTFEAYYNGLYICEDSGLTSKEGAYTLTAVVNGESREASFRVEEDQPQVQGGYLDQEWTYASFQVQLTGDQQKVTKAELVAEDGTCYGEDSTVSRNISSYDSRYTTVGEGGSVYMKDAYQIYSYYGSLEAYRNRTPAGSYDLRFTYEDGSTQTFAGAFQVVADGKAYINRIYSTGGYDSSADQLYFVAEGGNADFSRLDYHVTYAGAERQASYVSAKRNGDRYIVRLKKEGWTVVSGSEITLGITAKEGYDIDICSERTNIWISSGVYYVEWNPVSYALEVAVTQDMEVTSMRVELKNHVENWEDEGEEFLTGETDQVKQGFASVPMRDAEGRTVFVPREYYRVKIYLNGSEEPAYNQREYLGSYSSGSSSGGVSAYWSGSSILNQGTDNVDYVYNSALEYSKHKNDSFVMKLEDESGTEIKTLSTKLSSRKSGSSEYVRITVSSAEFCDQEAGKYVLRLYREENELSGYSLAILQKGRFYLGYQSASWVNDDTIQISIQTSNFKEKDKICLEMYDPLGARVEGLRTAVSNPYSNGYMYLNVTGLRRQESYRKYWIRITHTEYGEPYRLASPDSYYYSDEKGAQTVIGGYSAHGLTSNNRLVGVYYKGWKLPITINAYLPYDTEIKSAFTAQTAADYGSGEYKISFTKAFIDKLEDKDRLYDVTVTDNAGRSTLITGYALGYSGTTSKLTGLTLAPSTVKLAAGETAKLTLGAKPANAPMPSSVSWKSSNEKVAKVDAQGVVTGVGYGTATITVTGGGFSAKCSVTVTDSVKAPTADPAEGEVEKNTVVHLKSETAGAAIYYTTDGSAPTAKSLKYNDNAGITIRRETTIQAIAVKTGYTDSKAATFHYTVPEVTVTFDADGGMPETAPQTVDKGDYLDPVKIYEPEKDGFRFGGWYTADGDELDVNAPVTAAVTYTAKWEEGTQLLKPQANYQDSKELADGARVVLTVSTEAGAAVKDADIYYTLDGTTPTKESSLYEGAILLHKEGTGDETVTVKAFAAGKGYKQSEVSSYTYTLLQDAEAVFGEIEAEDIQNRPVPDGLWIAGLEEGYTYTGSAIKPQIRVYDGARKLVEKKDYTIAYKNNVNVSLPDTKQEKLPVIRITGKGNYKSEVHEQTFVIEPKDISDSDVTAEDLYVTDNKKEQKKTPVLKWGRKALSAKKQKDYSVDYGMGDYMTPGRYTITLEGQGNYTGTRTVTETILQAKTEYMMSKMSVTVKDQKLAYTGEALTPEVVVKNGKTELSRDDYEVTYLNNVEVGKATIRVRGLRDYKGVKEAAFQITGIPMNKVKVEGMEDKVYTAGIQEYTQTGCQLTYSYKDAQKNVQTRTLTENIDYTVSYRSNTNAGKAEILFTGKGAYTGVLKKSFTIRQCTDFNPEVQHAPEVSYCKGGARPEVTVKIGDVTLVNGTDYKVAYQDNTKVYDAASSRAKKAKIVITGTGSYKGKVTKEFVILPKDISGLEMSAQDVVYNTKAGNYKTKAVITDTDGKALKEKADYKLTYYIDGKKVEDKDRLTAPAGTEVTVRAEGQGAYTGTAETVFRVAEKAFGGVKGAIPEQSYTGSEITLSKDQITLTIGKGKDQETLTGEDYDIVGYKNNIKKGTATVILKGKGKYAGTRNLTFKITARDFKF